MGPNKIADLMAQDWTGLQRGTTAPEIEKQITQLGLDYRLMTQFTSFVAVEERTVTDGGTPVTVQVPVEMPDGVSYEGIFGNEKKEADIAYGAAGGVIGARAYQSVTVDSAAPLVKMRNPASIPLPPPAIPRVATKSDELTARYDATMPTESRVRRDKLQPRLDATLLQAWSRDKLTTAKASLPPACTKQLRSNVRVEVFLKNAPADALARLKNLGFVPETSSKTLIGSVPIAALDKIAALEFVDFIKSLPNGTSARK